MGANRLSLGGTLSLLPRTESLFLVLRTTMIAGVFLWAIGGAGQPLTKDAVWWLLASFAVHYVAVAGIIGFGLVPFRILFWLTLVFDIVFVGVLVRSTGGVASNFFILYYLGIPFAAYHGGLRLGMIAASAATISYLVANIGDPVRLFFGESLFRISILWVFTAATGAAANFIRRSEGRLLNALDKLNERTTEVEQTKNQLETIYETSRSLGTIHDVDGVVEKVLSIVQGVLNHEFCEVFLWDKNDRLWLKGRLDGHKLTCHNEPRPARAEPIYRRVLSSGVGEREVIRRQARRSGDADGARSRLVVPMMSSGRAVGLLTAQSSRINAFGDRDERVLAILANSAAMALQNAHMHRRLEKMTIIDELTDVYNYRHFKVRFADEIRRTVRYNQPLSLIMVDIDWFKKINDSLGHETGNSVLKQLTRTIGSCIRDVDILARYGGEEFVIILPQTTQAEAHKIGERIRSHVSKEDFGPDKDGRPVSLTVSVGLSTFPTNGHPEGELIEQVDQALYRAKGSGKNVVCTA